MCSVFAGKQTCNQFTPHTPASIKRLMLHNLSVLNFDLSSGHTQQCFACRFHASFFCNAILQFSLHLHELTTAPPLHLSHWRFSLNDHADSLNTVVLQLP